MMRVDADADAAADDRCPSSAFGRIGTGVVQSRQTRLTHYQYGRSFRLVRVAFSCVGFFVVFCVFVFNALTNGAGSRQQHSED